ncbi:MAG: hypothetical protein M1826_003916 [Phylliscum demangeonii]|nr:MAG: hypothetical protein M1826_003916 [Phylliscum demangeonii]
MAVFFHLLIAVLALARTTSSLAWRGPAPTAVGVVDENALLQGFSPRPTNGPDAGHLVRLVKRSVADSVCGYESALSFGEVTCSPGRTCYFYTATNLSGMRGCCTGNDYDNCGMAATCIDARVYATNCGASCVSDPYIVKCSDPASPFCQTWVYPDVGVVDYGCGTGFGSTIRTVYTTYAGQTDAYRAKFATISRTTDSSPIAVPTTTRPISNGGGDNIVHRTSNSVAAIVGGVVGGLAVIGLVSVAILVCLCCRRRRRRRATAAANMNGNAFHQGGGPVGAGSGGPPQHHGPALMPEKPQLSPSYVPPPMMPAQQQQQQQQQLDDGLITAINPNSRPPSTHPAYHRPSYSAVPSHELPSPPLPSPTSPLPGMMPQQQQQHQFDAGLNPATSPDHRLSYMAIPSHELSGHPHHLPPPLPQLHGDDVRPTHSPVHLDGSPVHEAPGLEARRR